MPRLNIKMSMPQSSPLSARSTVSSVWALPLPGLGVVRRRKCFRARRSASSRRPTDFCECFVDESTGWRPFREGASSSQFFLKFSRLFFQNFIILHQFFSFFLHSSELFSFVHFSFFFKKKLKVVSVT